MVTISVVNTCLTLKKTTGFFRWGKYSITFVICFLTRKVRLVDFTNVACSIIQYSPLEKFHCIFTSMSLYWSQTFSFLAFYPSSLVPVEFCAYLAKLGYPSRQFAAKTQYKPSMLWKSSPVHFKGWKQLHPALHLCLKPSFQKNLHTFQPPCLSATSKSEIKITFPRITFLKK